MAWVRARAYSSSANLGPGFDVLSVALDAYYDEVEARLSSEPGVRVVSVEGPYAEGSGGAASAARAVEALFSSLGVDDGVELRVYKGVPPGRGLGSSGASAAAAVVAVNELLGLGLSRESLVGFAGEGERVSAGVAHYDNVAASILGGMVVASQGRDGLKLFTAPLNALFAVVTPLYPVPEGKTGVMRSVLPGEVPLGVAVRNAGRAAGIVAAAFTGDLEALGELMSLDEIVEPRRAPHVRCYREVREAAFNAGALGFALSGAGPSMIALAGAPGDEARARAIAEAMRDACTCCEGALAAVAGVAGPAEVTVRG